MGYSADVVNKVRDEYAEKRKRATKTLDRHLAEACAKCDTFNNLSRALSATGLVVLRASLGNPHNLEERIAEIKEESMKLQERKRELLKENGFPED